MHIQALFNSNISIDQNTFISVLLWSWTRDRVNAPYLECVSACRESNTTAVECSEHCHEDTRCKMYMWGADRGDCYIATVES